MSHNSTYTSPSLTHVCSDRPADSTRIVSYIRRQQSRTVPNVDIVGSSKCHTRHLATWGVACFNYVLVTNSNPVTTCASDGQVNTYPNMVCSNPSFSMDLTEPSWISVFWKERHHFRVHEHDGILSNKRDPRRRSGNYGDPRIPFGATSVDV